MNYNKEIKIIFPLKLLFKEINIPGNILKQVGVRPILWKVWKPDEEN